MTESGQNLRPGAAALSNMALMEAESKLFKVPESPKPLHKNKSKLKVMDEEDYVEGIARIIQRDFFPDLEKLNAQNEYLEASENKDYARLREIIVKYSGGKPKTTQSGDATPATFETPTVHPGSPTLDARSDENPKMDTNTMETIDTITQKHSLDSFLAEHTSEDNRSYDKLIALEERRQRLKSLTQFEAEVSSAELVRRAIQLPSIEQQADQTNKPDELDTWAFKAKNYIMYVPDGDKSNRPVHKPELIHDNTRLRVDPFAAVQLNKEKPKTLIKGKVGVDGNCIDAPPAPSPRGFVSTPSPRPGALGDESPMMTWGEIEGTPFRLDGGDTPIPALGAGKSYKMLDWGARERIGLKLAEQVAKKRRPTTPQLKTPSPSLRSNRLSTMSPAARKFAAKHLLTPRMRISPAPSRPLTPRTPASPRAAQSLVAKRTKPATPKPDLTDNLLNINLPSRLKAKDFFT